MLAQDPSEKTYQILQKVPSNSEDIVELTLKMLLSESAILSVEFTHRQSCLGLEAWKV